jgi:hypothetical protein
MDDVKNWTIMVYFAGDNNLNTEMAYALEQLREITKINPNISLYVYYDGFSCNVPTLYCDFSEPNSPIKYFMSSKIQNKLINRKIRKEETFNENSASMNNILNFIDWCVRKDKYTESGEESDRRGAKKYAMIFSGHSFGFMDWGLYKDEKANYYMTLSKLQWLFQRVTDTAEVLKQKAEKDQADDEREAAGRKRKFIPWSEEKYKERTTEILGKPLDLLGFDSCEMSTLEIGCQFRKLAKTMVASEGSVPNAGWSYAQILLGKLKDQPNMDARETAVSFVEDFIKQQNRFALADISVDMAAWDLNALSPLEQYFEELVDNLHECFKDNNSASYHQMRRLLAQVHWQCQTYLLEQHVDLGDFCGLLHREIRLLETEIDPEKIAPVLAVGKSCVEVIKKLKECVLLTGFSGSDFQYSNGISLFFPWSLSAYQCAQSDYEKLSFIELNAAGKKWNEFLKKYLGEITMRPAKQLTPTDREGNAIIDSETSSVIYESYTLLGEKHDRDAGFMPTIEEGKRPPNDFRRPPNDFRRPPNDFKMLGSNINIFLSRFMKLKNFEPNWNRSGFSANPNAVRFSPESDEVVRPETNDRPAKTERSKPEPRPVPPSIMTVVIKKGTGINKTKDEISSKLNTWGLNNRSGKAKEYNQLFDEILEKTSQSTKIKVLGSLAHSKALNEPEKLNNGNAETSLKKDFDKAIKYINDPELKTDFLSRLDKIGSNE